VRDDDEEEEVLEVGQDARGQHDHPGGPKRLEQEERQREGGHAAEEDEEVAEEFAEQVLCAADGLGEDERVYAVAVVAHDRVAHQERVEERQREEGEAAEVAHDVEVAVGRPAVVAGRAALPPEHGVGDEEREQRVRDCAPRVVEQLGAEDGGEGRQREALHL
jgi:hypothetical protein